MKGRIILNLESKPRVLAHITYLLSKSKVNIEDINYVDTGDRVIVDLTVDDPKKAVGVLQQNKYEPTMLGKFMLVALKDQPGELFKISKMLDDNGVRLLRVDIVSKGSKMAVVSLLVDKKRKAEKLLKPYLI
ncbi:hypothetical protein J7J90_03980 [Candidatus Micrarchaeota archaeon]|nr:hypothetical protein [Candidatus Micrarchaeota archaeon]